MGRGWQFRQRARHIKMMRRLKSDFNEHYNDLECACYYDPKVQAMMADTPKRCSSPYHCGNPRRGDLGRDSLTIQELRQLPKLREASLYLGRVAQADRDGFNRPSLFFLPI